ncbi:MAG: hypothetical protein MSH44_01430, partial [Christensenellaceae bacterium]|nr:hypothetical protein [Christensenellaceae bacterium]
KRLVFYCPRGFHATRLRRGNAAGTPVITGLTLTGRKRPFANTLVPRYKPRISTKKTSRENGFFLLSTGIFKF